MKAKYDCPKCGHDVPIANINVAKDILLCPSCGEVSSFSAIVSRSEAADHDDDLRRKLSTPPPKHLTVETDPTDMSGRITLTFKKFSKAALFLVPFTCVWAGGSMTAIYGTQIYKHAFDWKMSLFGIPFLIGSIVLVSTCLFMLFGKRVLTLERGKGVYFYGVGPFGFRKRFTFNRSTEIEPGCTSYSSNGQSLPELHLTNSGDANKIHICAGMSEDALEYVEAVLKREAARV